MLARSPENSQLNYETRRGGSLPEGGETGSTVAFYTKDEKGGGAKSVNLHPTTHDFWEKRAEGEGGR